MAMFGQTPCGVLRESIDASPLNSTRCMEKGMNRAVSPVKDVQFGEALKISLNNYYDLLKTQVGGLVAEEVIQLKLVADTIDISERKKPSEGGYEWFSYTNLLNRSDRGIQPTPVAGELQIGLDSLVNHYARFIRKLRSFVVIQELSADDQIALADLDKVMSSLKAQALALRLADAEAWKKSAEAMGYEVGNWSVYLQWSGTYGNIRAIEDINTELNKALFRKRTILNRSYKNPDDKEVIDAEANLENPLMRLRYPLFPDYQYDEGDSFSPSYLGRLPLGSTALFDDRHAANWDKTPDYIRTNKAGSFKAVFDKTTVDSSSITTDWSGGGSVSYGFISVSASASEHKSIQEEFRKGKAITLGAEATMRVNIVFPSWFNPVLFRHRYVLENPFDFQEFFGAKGSLLYYPTALIVVRGFSVSFESSEAWTYDYHRTFSASGGGGFRAFGIGFGAKGSYSVDQKEHKVDKSNTTLTIADDKSTVRFVGYAVRKNDVFTQSLQAGQKGLLAFS
jgi:hypothetical protein